MDIKVIAVDMDGTFLNSQNDYHRERFKKAFERMKQLGIRFLSISGNQYYQIKSFFPDVENEMTFVSENGAYMVDRGKFIKSYRLDNRIVRLVLDYLREHQFESEMVLCGEKSAYMLSSVTDEVFNLFNIYYTRLQRVDSFDELPDDHFMKFSFNIPEAQTQSIMADLNQKLGEKVTAVSSGDGNIDVISKGRHKGAALMELCEIWGYDPEQCLAFGDGGNDIELLKASKYSYAMENGSDAIKEVAQYSAPSNDEDGVLTVIEQYLDEMENSYDCC